MKPEDVPASTLLVDTDVVSWLALGEARSEQFAALLAGHELFISFTTLAEVKTFLALNVLEAPRKKALQDALDDYSILSPSRPTSWSAPGLRSAQRRSATPPPMTASAAKTTPGSPRRRSQLTRRCQSRPATSGTSSRSPTHRS